MVQQNKPVVGFSPSCRAAALVAACVLAGSLAACGDSPTAAANKVATENSAKAARQIASAGDTRASEALIKQVYETPISGLSELDKQIKAKLTPNSDAYKTYISKRPVMDDLAEADKLLKLALSSPGQPSESVQAVVVAQQAHVANLEAQTLLAQLQEQMLALATKASDIQTLASRITVTGKLATAIDAHKETGTQGLSKAIEDAKTGATTAEATVKEKQSALQALEAQIIQKRDDGQKLLQKAQADQLAATQAKGDASVEAFKQAIAVKAQAELLLQEVSILEPQRDAAANDANAAQIQLTEAQTIASTMQTSLERQTANIASAQNTARQLHEQATGMVKAPENGLEAQVKDFLAAAAKIDEKVNHIETLAKSAAANYANAKRLPAGETNTRDIATLFQICQAGANAHAGEANLAAWAIADLQNAVAKTAGAAYAAADYKTDPIVDAGNKGKTAKEEGLKQLQTADDILKAITEGGGVADLSAPKWLAFSLRSIVNNGLYAFTGDTDKLKLTREAAEEALKRNPNLPLRGLAHQ